MKLELGKEIIEKNWISGKESFRIKKYRIVGIYLDYDIINNGEYYKERKMFGVISLENFDSWLKNDRDFESYIYRYNVEELDDKFVESEEDYNNYFKEEIKKIIEKRNKEIEELNSCL